MGAPLSLSWGIFWEGDLYPRKVFSSTGYKKNQQMYSSFVDNYFVGLKD